MAILGTLSEFPLPEVMLLLGSRSGTLRLYDVPRYGHMEVEVCRGNLGALYVGGKKVSEIEPIVKELCSVVELGQGMFEFQPEEMQSPYAPTLIPLQELVTMVIIEVDEAVSRKEESLAKDVCYSVTNPAPDIWIDDELEHFFLRCLPYLQIGMLPGPLAEKLGLDADMVRENLHTLSGLGFVKEGSNYKNPSEAFQAPSADHLAQEIAELKKITARLLEVCPRIIWRTKKRITQWDEIAVHGSRFVAQFEDRLYNLHEGVRLYRSRLGTRTPSS